MSNNYILSTLTNLAVLETSFTEEELTPLKNEINEIQSNFSKAVPLNSDLVGHIKKEYRLSKSRNLLESLTKPFLKNYVENYFRHEHTLESPNFRLGQTWVNFQKKHEFNPFHHHRGLVSFVLWISIPYYSEDEAKIYPDVNENNKTGLFEFQYLNYLGQIQYNTIVADKRYENRMIMFPAGLKHCVYPFYTSDEYRITVSGNFHANFGVDTDLLDNIKNNLIYN
jgi:hypothetical protein